MSTKIKNIETHPYNQGALAGRYALTDLSNSGIMTNILLSLPSRHKITQNGNKLTLQKGSTVTIPNGASEQGTVDNIYEYIPQNIDFSIPTDSIGRGPANYRYVVYDKETKAIKWASTKHISGNKYPLTFDFDDNFIYAYDTSKVSLPLGYITEDENGNKVFKVFNTIGFYENIVWADRGVKAMLPSGRTPEYKLSTYDINVSSTVYTSLDEKPCTGSVLIFKSDSTFGIVSRISYSETFVPFQGSYYLYVSNDNIICDSTQYQINCCKAANITIGAGGLIEDIYNFNTYKTVSFNEIRDTVNSDIELAFEALKEQIDDEVERIEEENARLDEEAAESKK